MVFVFITSATDKGPQIPSRVEGSSQKVKPEFIHVLDEDLYFSNLQATRAFLDRM